MYEPRSRRHAIDVLTSDRRSICAADVEKRARRTAKRAQHAARLARDYRENQIRSTLALAAVAHT